MACVVVASNIVTAYIGMASIRYGYGLCNHASDIAMDCGVAASDIVMADTVMASDTVVADTVMATDTVMAVSSRRHISCGRIVEKTC